MLYKIQDRMDYILNRDKICDPQRVCLLLQDELKPIVENYINIEKEIKVRFKKEGEKNIFFVEIEAQRIKPFGYIPR